jgi:hypothetical protein
MNYKSTYWLKIPYKTKEEAELVKAEIIKTHPDCTISEIKEWDWHEWSKDYFGDPDEIHEKFRKTKEYIQ